MKLLPWVPIDSKATPTTVSEKEKMIEQEVGRGHDGCIHEEKKCISMNTLKIREEVIMLGGNLDITDYCN